VAGAAVLGRLTWLLAEVLGEVVETARVKSLVLDVPGWPGHRPGQHVDVRLTAEDGYQAQRSYSIASPPDDERLVLTVERLDDGEVSPYLVDELRTGDRLELRGPIGGYFVWDSSRDDSLLLVAGGSGLVPLMAMLRHHRATGSAVDARLLLSARSPEDVLYRDELEGLGDAITVHTTLTRGPVPDGWRGFTGRINGQILAAVGPEPSLGPSVYVCGPTPFVEEAARLLVELGHDPAKVHTERFGPTGG
jgi:ferredoxin-NADP reductase